MKDNKGKIIGGIAAGIAIIIAIVITSSYISESNRLPDPNVNRTTSTDIHLVPKSQVLDTEQFSVSTLDTVIRGIPLLDGENRKLIIQGTVHGDGIVKIELVRNDQGGCECKEIGILKGDSNWNIFLSGENKINRDIESEEKVFLQFSSDSTNKQLVNVSMSLDYYVKEVTTN